MQISKARRFRGWHALLSSLIALALHLALLPSFFRHRRTMEWEPGLLRALLSLEFLVLAVALVAALLPTLAWRRSPPRWIGLRVLALLSLLALLAMPTSAPRDFNIWQPLSAELAAEDAPNIVVLISDSLRGDVFDDVEQAQVRFPVLQSLREQSLDYRQLQSASSWTPPSMAGLLTGGSPAVLGAHRGTLPDSALSFVEILRDAGYETVGISDNHLTHPRYGYAQGFTRYWQRNNCIPFAESLLSHWRWAGSYERWIRWCRLQYRGAERVEAALASWAARRDRDRPFFLLVHYMDTHYPYYVYDDRPENLSLQAEHENFRLYSEVQLLERDLPHAPFANAELTPEQHRNFWLRYLGSAQVVDQSVGRVRDWLQREDVDAETLLLFTADHGEEFHEHGTLAHGRALYQESIRVPCFLRPPAGTAAPGVVEAPMSQRRIANTLLAAAGLATMPGAPDPLPVQASRLGAAVFSELDRSGTRILAGRFGDLKLLHAVTRTGRTRSELYQLADDPEERVDLEEEIAALPRPLLTEFQSAWLQLVQSPSSHPDAGREDLLRGLGYLR